MGVRLSRGRHGGFTLFEVLIAIGIFSIIGLGAHHVLQLVISSEAVAAAHSASRSELQRAMLLLSNDLEQAFDRPIRDADGERLTAFSAGNNGYLLEFTRQGWRNPLRLPRSNLQRVAYKLENRSDTHAPGDFSVSLVRCYWLVLDRAPDSEPQSQVLLDKVADVRFRFLSPGGDWHLQWPLRPAAADAAAGADVTDSAGWALPVAVEMTLETANGLVKRLFQTGEP